MKSDLFDRPNRTDPWIVRRDWFITMTMLGTAYSYKMIAQLTYEDLRGDTSLPLWLTFELDRWRGDEGIEEGHPIFPRRQGEKAAISATTVQSAVKRTSVWTATDVKVEYSKRPLPVAIALNDVFCTDQPFGDHDEQMFTMLSDELQDRAIAVVMIKLPDTRLRPEVINCFSGNTEAHKRLCARAATWLEDMELEWEYDGGYAVNCIADVHAKAKPIFIECGYTCSRKVLEGVAANNIIVVCPYFRYLGAGFCFKRITESELRYERYLSDLQAQAVNLRPFF